MGFYGDREDYYKSLMEDWEWLYHQQKIDRIFDRLKTDHGDLHRAYDQGCQNGYMQSFWSEEERIAYALGHQVFRGVANRIEVDNAQDE